MRRHVPILVATSLQDSLGRSHVIAVDLPDYSLSDEPLHVTYDFDFFADVLDVQAYSVEHADLPAGKARIAIRSPAPA